MRSTETRQTIQKTPVAGNEASQPHRSSHLFESWFGEASNPRAPFPSSRQHRTAVAASWVPSSTSRSCFSVLEYERADLTCTHEHQAQEGPRQRSAKERLPNEGHSRGPERAVRMGHKRPLLNSNNNTNRQQEHQQKQRKNTTSTNKEVESKQALGCKAPQRTRSETRLPFNSVHLPRPTGQKLLQLPRKRCPPASIDSARPPKAKSCPTTAVAFGEPSSNSAVHCCGLTDCGRIEQWHHRFVRFHWSIFPKTKSLIGQVYPICILPNEKAPRSGRRSPARATTAHAPPAQKLLAIVR